MSTRRKPRRRPEVSAQDAIDLLRPWTCPWPQGNDLFSDSDEELISSQNRDSIVLEEAFLKNRHDDADLWSSNDSLFSDVEDDTLKRCKEVQLALKQPKWIREGKYTFEPNNEATRGNSSLRNAEPFDHSRAGPVGHAIKKPQEHAMFFLKPFISFLSSTTDGTPRKRKRGKPVASACSCNINAPRPHVIDIKRSVSFLLHLFSRSQNQAPHEHHAFCESISLVIDFSASATSTRGLAHDLLISATNFSYMI